MKPLSNLKPRLQSLLFKSVYSPFILFAVLLVVLFISIRLAGRVPIIDGISPRVATPGEILMIKGRGFGKKTEGNVSVAGIIPTSSSYLDWSDSRITVRIPEDTKSGLVYVINGYGRSNGMLFTNRSYIPEIVSGPAKPGFPYIEELDPGRGSPGTLITVHGQNFGINRAESTVSFTWVPSDGNDTNAQDDKASFLPCQDTDFDYEYWSDREIRIRVPTGAVSGNLFVKTDRGESNTAFFEIVDEVGTRLYHDKVTYAIQNTLEIKAVSAEQGNGLYLWVPHVLESPSQRAIQVMNRDPVPMMENFQGSTLYHLNELVPGNGYRVSQSFLVERYTEENRIRAVEVRKYDTAKKLYQAYTSPDTMVPSGEPDIVKASRSVTGKEKNPWLIARALYDHVRKTLSYSGSGTNALAAFKAKTGSAYEYAVLYAALLRASGVPARTVSGYLVGENLYTIPHVWTEFYLENYGWVPVDPLLGDQPAMSRFTPGADAPEFYFGSIDNRHIELAKGIREVKQMDPKGRVVRKEKPFGFQSFHEEAVGNLKSYSSYWGELVIQGIY